MSHLAARPLRPGASAIAQHGWWRASRWLIARRVSQLSILALFLMGPWAGIWVIKGNLSASLLLDTVPMSDVFVFAQSLAARHWPYETAWIGLGVVLAFYLLVGGRAYCSWVCPVNLVTDAASWARRRIGLKTGKTPPRALRQWLLLAVLVASAGSGQLIWEWVNPVSMAHRALIFGGGMALLIVLGVFLFDLLIAPRGWCGHVCPMGACYGHVNRLALTRVSAVRREACNDCMDCYAVCPEPQVIRPALKAENSDASPLIRSADCTNCGRCIDVCSESVFALRTRFNTSVNRLTDHTPRREAS